MVISAASIERFLKWGAVPLALVVALFVSRYSDDIFGTSDAPQGELTSPRAESAPQAGLVKLVVMSGQRFPLGKGALQGTPILVRH